MNNNKSPKTVPFLKGDERRNVSEASEGDEKTIKTATTVPFTKGDEKNERFSEGDKYTSKINNPPRLIATPPCKQRGEF
jgi:hypothetical protein